MPERFEIIRSIKALYKSSFLSFPFPQIRNCQEAASRRGRGEKERREERGWKRGGEKELEWLDSRCLGQKDDNGAYLFAYCMCHLCRDLLVGLLLCLNSHH